MAVFANIGGWIADTLVQRGVSVTNVRKVSCPSVILFLVWNCGFIRRVMLRATALEIPFKLNDADHAINWFPWTSLVLDSADQSSYSSYGRIMYGMQSGLKHFRKTTYRFISSV